MTADTLVLFAVTELLLSLSPGPAVLLVVSLAIRAGSLQALWAAAGIIALNAFYFALSALGIGALILASSTLFTALKWVGAAYLVWLGIGMIRPILAHLVRGEPLVDGAAGHTVPSRRGAFWKGFAVQGANPKNLAFFVALLPQFLAPEGDVATQLVLLGIVSVLVELPVLVAYALLASASLRWLSAPLMRWVEGGAGALLVGLGAALAPSRDR
jgi:threonine/homoserine/homoserine lactone efflux protein